MTQHIFSSAEIFLPDWEQVCPETWSVIACDQFTSSPEYWEQAGKLVGDAPSALNLILPELYLEQSGLQERIDKIHAINFMITS